MISALLFVAILSQETPRDVPREALGHGFIEDCKADPAAHPPATSSDAWSARVARTACTTYLEGLADGLTSGGLLCTPAGVTVGQLRAVVIKYLEDHPELLHEERFVLATKALKPWACRPAKK